MSYFNHINQNEYRTHYCEKLNTKHVNQKVTVSGWLDTKRDHGNLLFIALRDGSGIIQCVFETGQEAFEIADKASRESVLQITGTALKRSDETINPDLPTGQIEIKAETCKVLSKAKPLPFDNNQPISDECKLKYRYLYMRREHMQKNITLRANVLHYLRNAMEERDFMEVQTPILTASSPEGARDYLVPSYIHKGRFYALPQAPQQFKQILMASGINRYFQIAPCFRAESSRADRSPGEFYQLDMEMAFATQQDVFNVIEPVMEGLFKKFYQGEVDCAPFTIIEYAKAMEEFCSDKPDLRNPLRYENITEQFKANPPALLKTLTEAKGFCAKILAVMQGNKLSRKIFDDLQKHVQSEGLGGLAYAKLEAGVWSGPGAKMIPETVLQKSLKEDGVVFLLAGQESLVNKIGGPLRNMIYFEAMQNPLPRSMKFCWVVDYPLYEVDEATKQIIFSHNPFSMPQGGLEALKTKDPLTLKAWQYDLVCNGIELCSGAIRNHEPETLKKAFEIAGYNYSETEEKFGAMLAAFEAGVPPHGGAAPGVDRIIMMLADEHNIREVIAFPLSQNAQDLLMHAPTPATTAQLKELGLQIQDDSNKG